MFAWTTVRYKSISGKQPEKYGICPGLAHSSKPALVVSRVAADGDPKWLNALADLYHLCIYTADAPIDENSRNLQVPANRGHEAMAYLTFLIDNYEHIPAAGAVFVHGSRWAWHNDAPDYDNAALLAALNVSAALAPWGYHNLRCDWSASMCPLSEKPQGSLDTSLNAMLEPWNARAVSDAALPRALVTLFGGNGLDPSKEGERLRLGRTHTVRAQCCAQFVVAQDRIWQHSHEEYIGLRQWLLDGTQFQNHHVAPRDDRVAGRILSYIWHILFMQQGDIDLALLNTQACPPANECYCRLYGRCNLKGCTSDESCHGQYRVPPGFKLPDNWADTHS